MPSRRNTSQRNFTVSRLQTKPSAALRLRHRGETNFSDVDVAYHMADGDGSEEMCDALPDLPPKSCYLITQAVPGSSVFEAHVIPEFFKLQTPPDFKTTAGTVVAGHGGSGTSSRSNSVSRTGSMSSTARQSQSHTQRPSGTSSNTSSGFTVRPGSVSRPSGTSTNANSGSTAKRTHNPVA
ncbi:hypothetical protein HYALB_00013169 [Hymenoscyphus albidus]|uniref:Uncharacterized protein n=1 Tax=Hymenoscyphus albidus TaxID=595503 RepID=A0A9N9QBJ3_9HELO|nr:hypothetical protein HYALB_00013169 [Hymenoscyphus albidus]